jgi:localization factor PodJL
MASDVAWNMKGLEPEVRETAREAARRAGLSVAEWLQSVIISAAGEGAAPVAAITGRSEGRSQKRESRREGRSAGDAEEGNGTHAENPDPSIHIRSIDARLAALSEQLERLARVSPDISLPPERTGPGRSDDAELTAALHAIESRLAEFTRDSAARAHAPVQQVADALAQLDHRLDRLIADGRVASSDRDNRIASVDHAIAALNRDGAQPPHALHAEHAVPSERTPASASIPSEDEAAPAEARPTLRVPHSAQPAESMQRGVNTRPAEPELTPFGFDAALAEIAQRQQALDEAEAPGPLEQRLARLSQKLAAGGGDEPAAPHDFSGLHQQIRELTDRLESLHGPGGFQEMIVALRQELAEIGRKLTEAAPRRAVEALQAEVHALAERVDIGRFHGADAASLAGVERGLAELREALHGLAPAESLVEFREDVKTLDRKIAQIAAGGADSAALRQLEHSVAELRQIAARTASGEALIALAEEVQALGDKIERFVVPTDASSDILSGLDQRFQELAATFEARVAAAGSTDGHELVAVIEALADRIERVELARDSIPALDAIAAQLVRLSERLDAAGARLENLDAIERGLSNLFEQIEDLRANATAVAERAGKEAALEIAGTVATATFEVDALKHELDTLRAGQTQNERRTQNTLEAVHDTLERLVDRLAVVETEMRGDDNAAPAAEWQHAPQPQPSPTSALAEPRRLSVAAAPAVGLTPERRPIDPTLPADHPLEPGTAAPRVRPASAAERIAASEAAIGGKPSVAPEAASKADFIAAARRAAQAAATIAGPSPPAGGNAAVSTLGAIAQKLTRRRPLLLGLAILAIAGTLHIVINVLGSSEPRRTDPAERSGPAASQTAAPAPAPAKPQASLAKPAIATSAVAPAPPSGLPPLSLQAVAESAPAAPAERDLTSRDAAAPAQESRTTTTVSPLTIASIQLPASPEGTGSTGRASGFTLSNAAPMPNLGGTAAPATSSAAGAIPSGLRSAAMDGNPAAAYEFGLRHAEGRGTPVNLEEAARWFERAAEQGIAPAQYRLGSFYEKGQGVKKDVEKARRLYTAAAEKGNAKAMHNLAVLYAEGIDGKPDFKPSSYWFRKAAGHGVADSQYNLAILHARGLGVEQNLAESYKWFALAAQQGDQDAGRKRDEVASRIDPQALIAARLAVQTFTAEPQPEEAVAVKAAPGGWDAVAPAAPRGKSRVGVSVPRKLGAT